MYNNIRVNELVFTQEERKKLEKVIYKGRADLLTCVIENITPEKEYELNKIINDMRPLTEGFSSQVKDIMEKDFKKRKISGPESPEEEAKWEKMLQDEFAEFVDKQNKKREEMMNGLKVKAEAKEKKEINKEEVKIEEKKPIAEAEKEEIGVPSEGTGSEPVISEEEKKEEEKPKIIKSKKSK